MSEKLSELKKQRARLDKQIKDAERSEQERVRAETIARDYQRAVCPECAGVGEVGRGGADIISDAPWMDACERCGGNGFILVRPFTDNRPFPDKHAYDMTYNEAQ